MTVTQAGMVLLPHQAAVRAREWHGVHGRRLAHHPLHQQISDVSNIMNKHPFALEVQA